MIRLSGNVPRYQAGKYRLISSLLPCRGGMKTARRLMRPAATSTSFRFSSSRWRNGLHRPSLTVQANWAGVAALKLVCSTLEEAFGKFNGLGVVDDTLDNLVLMPLRLLGPHRRLARQQLRILDAVVQSTDGRMQPAGPGDGLVFLR